MQFKKKLLVALVCAISFPTYAQQFASLSGEVRDNAGEPMFGATVKLSKTTTGTICDENGHFIIQNLTPGLVTIEISAVGYKTQTRQLNLIAGKEQSLKIKLEESAIGMQTVEVTGHSNVQESNRQAYNITAIDAKKLHNTTLNLADALDRVAGVRVRESGGVGSNFNMSLNGFSGNHIRFFIDGIPMENFGTSFQINNIPINLAERVEVYKGVVPVWLGSDALGGAVNIITGNRFRNDVDVSYSYGSFNTHRTVFNGAVTSKKGFTFQLNAFQNYSDNSYKVKVDAADINTGAYSPNTIVKRFHDTYHNESVIANVGVVNKKIADKLLIGITLGQNYKEIQTGARMVSVFGGWHRKGNIVMPSLKYKKTDLIKGLDVTLNANYNLGSEQNIDTVNARFDWYGNRKENGSNGERSRTLYKYRNNNGIATAMINYRFKEHHNIALSNVFTTFNRKGSDELNVLQTAQSQKSQKNVLAIGYTYDVKNKWNVSVFGKELIQRNVILVTANKAITDRMGYGIIGTYFPMHALQLKASYELTNRLPEANEIFGDVENQEGNANLKPEKSDNANLGISYSFHINKKNEIAINVNGVYRYSTDFIYTRLNSNQSKLVSDNREGVKTLGGDGEIRYVYNNWLSLGATMTYQQMINMQRYEPDVISGGRIESPVYKDQMPNQPFLFGNGDISVTLKSLGREGNNLNIGYNLLYVHAFYLYWPSRGFRDDKYDIPTQISHDINLLYSIKNGRYNIGVEARNIANAYQFDNFSLQKPGRAFYLTLRYFINKNQ